MISFHHQTQSKKFGDFVVVLFFSIFTGIACFHFFSTERKAATLALVSSLISTFSSLSNASIWVCSVGVARAGDGPSFFFWLITGDGGAAAASHAWVGEGDAIPCSVDLSHFGATSTRLGAARTASAGAARLCVGDGGTCATAGAACF